MSSGALKRVTVTGSESTGKSWLANLLARRFQTVCVPEFAREYVIHKGAPLDASDVEPIAHEQIRLENTMLPGARDVAILDTDLVSTVVYAEHYYGVCPPWVERAAGERLADHYLLCDIDVPWAADAARDQPHAREQIHAAFVDRLDRYRAAYTVIRGMWERREATAVNAVEALLASPSAGG